MFTMNKGKAGQLGPKGVSNWRVETHREYICAPHQPRFARQMFRQGEEDIGFQCGGLRSSKS